MSLIQAPWKKTQKLRWHPGTFPELLKKNIFWSHLQDFIQKLIRPNVDQHIISPRPPNMERGRQCYLRAGYDDGDDDDGDDDEDWDEDEANDGDDGDANKLQRQRQKLHSGFRETKTYF